jgi:hypothetical protein
MSAGLRINKDLGSASRERKASPCQTLVDFTVTRLVILTCVRKGIQLPRAPAGPYKSMLRRVRPLPVSVPATAYMRFQAH